MTDRFDIQRDWDEEGDRILQSARERLEEEKDRERARNARLIRLSPGYYFDPVDKALMKKAGGQFGFIRHDRRRARELKATQAEAEARGFRMVSGGLFWDIKAKKLYRKSGSNYLLYTSDRRKKAGVSTADERRRTKN